jgi:dynein heavy chain
MINSFKELLNERRKDVQNQIDKYSNGYDKILSTEENVDLMKNELIEMQPKLIVAKEETEKKIVVVSKEKELADVLKGSISEEEAIVTLAVNEANAIKDDC